MPPSTRRATRAAPADASPQKTAFVTVGTTKFAALVDAVDDPAFERALLARGYTRLAVQAGAGAAARPPRRLLPNGATSGVTKGGLTVDWFDYAPSLVDFFATAALAVSHSGAGSLFEALAAGCAVVAVPNAALMHNHQAELADALAGERVLVAATPDSLARVVKTADFGGLRPYVPGEAGGIVDVVDGLAGRRVGRRR